MTVTPNRRLSPAIASSIALGLCAVSGAVALNAAGFPLIETAFSAAAFLAAMACLLLLRPRDGASEEAQPASAEARAEDVLRLSLDHAQNNIMLADNHGRIVYVNKPVVALFKEAEAEIRKRVPGFAADKLLGSHFDVFHRSPAEQRSLVSGLKRPHSSQLVLGAHNFAFSATPVFDAKGARKGTVVEWRDCTAETRVQSRIDAVISAAEGGDFKQRVEPCDDVQLCRIAGKINKLLDNIETGFGETARVMAAMAQGDLSQRFEGALQGAFETLRHNVNTSAGRLSDLVRQIQAASERTVGAASEIASGAQALSARTESQASSLEETAAAMEEMTVTIRQNAENLGIAADLASETSEKGSKGGVVVADAQSCIARIEESSGKISDILGVIDGIAFQTNLLALNAAVEAARAGEAGKGFAVVASEVRSLAQRSSEAAKDIRELIKVSAAQVADGVEAVRATGAALEDIDQSVEKLRATIADVSSSSRDQATAVAEINAAIAGFDQMTQENAALSNESNSTAGVLRDEAEKLTSLTAVFHTGGEAPLAAAAPERLAS